MPVTISLGTNGIDFKQVFVKNLDVITRDETSVTFETKGGECGIELSSERIPTHLIGTIRIEAELLNKTKSGAPVPCEFYWATSYMPNFSPFASVFFLLRPGQSMQIMTRDLPGWNDTGTPLTRLRLDLGRERGLRIRVKRFVFEP